MAKMYSSAFHLSHGLLAAALLGCLPQAASASIVTAYDTVNSGSISATSSTLLNTVWGDRVLLSTTGVLDKFEFSLYNSGSSTGPLEAVNVLLRFYEGPTFNTSSGTGTLIGWIDGIVSFSTALPPGYFGTITVNAAALPTPINLASNDIFITQTLLANAGSANRLGIVTTSAAPVAGASHDGFFFRSNSNGTGLYQVSSTTTNVLYSLKVSPPAKVPSPLPVFGAAAALQWSRKLRRATLIGQQVEG